MKWIWIIYLYWIHPLFLGEVLILKNSKEVHKVFLEQIQICILSDVIVGNEILYMTSKQSVIFSFLFVDYFEIRWNEKGNS